MSHYSLHFVNEKIIWESKFKNLVILVGLYVLPILSSAFLLDALFLKAWQKLNTITIIQSNLFTQWFLTDDLFWRYSETDVFQSLNVKYVHIIEERLNEALTTYEKSFEGSYVRRSQKRYDLRFYVFQDFYLNYHCILDASHRCIHVVVRLLIHTLLFYPPPGNNTHGSNPPPPHSLIKLKKSGLLHNN